MILSLTPGTFGVSNSCQTPVGYLIARSCW